jgi:hypothetical protein
MGKPRSTGLIPKRVHIRSGALVVRSFNHLQRRDHVSRFLQFVVKAGNASANPLNHLLIPVNPLDE